MQPFGVCDDLACLGFCGPQRLACDVAGLCAERLDVGAGLRRYLLGFTLELVRDPALLGQLGFHRGGLGTEAPDLRPGLDQLGSCALFCGDNVGFALLELGGQLVKLLGSPRRHRLGVAPSGLGIGAQLLGIDGSLFFCCPLGLLALLGNPAQDRLYSLLGIGNELIGLTLCRGRLPSSFETVEIGLLPGPVGLVTNALGHRLCSRNDLVGLLLARHLQLLGHGGGRRAVAVEQRNSLGENGFEGVGLLDVASRSLHQRAGLGPPILDHAVGFGACGFKDRLLGGRQRRRLRSLDDAAGLFLRLGDHTGADVRLVGPRRLDLCEQLVAFAVEGGNVLTKLVGSRLSCGQGVRELSNLAGKPVTLLNKGSRVSLSTDDRRDLGGTPVGIGNDLGGATLGVCEFGGRFLVAAAGRDRAGFDGRSALPGFALDLLRLEAGSFQHPVLGVEDGEHRLIDIFLVPGVVLGEGQLHLGFFGPSLELAEVLLDLGQEGFHFLLVVSLPGGRELALIQGGRQLRRLLAHRAFIGHTPNPLDA